MSKFRFGGTSRTRLGTADPELQRLMQAVMDKQLMDFSIIQGHRSKAEQDAAYEANASKVRWPNSKHNGTPSLAVDIAPYPIRWGDPGDPDRVKAIGNFYRLAGIVLATAHELGINIRWGGDWDGDSDIYDQEFDDIVHFELGS